MRRRQISAAGVAARQARHPAQLVVWLARLVRVPDVGFTHDQLVACAKIAYQAYTRGRQVTRNTLRIRERRVSEAGSAGGCGGGGCTVADPGGRMPSG